MKESLERLKQIEEDLHTDGLSEKEAEWLIARCKKLEIIMAFSAGMISTQEQFKDKHPEEVVNYLEEACDFRDLNLND